MAFTVGKNNRTVLIGIPEAPAAFFNVTRPHGIIIVGYSSYSGSRASIVSNLQRTIGNRIFVRANIEEFITGILAVLLISLFSEIVQTVLLRTSNHAIAKNGLRTAYMLDEFSHFRNLWNQTTQRNPRKRAVPTSGFRRKSVLLSLFVLVFAFIIFVADVMAVYATRSRTFTTTAEQFNLRGVQPVGTTEAISTRVRFLTEERACILPKGMFETQQKHFRVAGCVEYETGTRTPPIGEKPDSITLQSWYHIGGSDHIVSVGTTWYSVKVRAMVFLERDGSMRRILFTESPNRVPDTQYLHNVTVYLAMQWACNKKKSKSNCSEIVNEVEFESDGEEEREITLWERKGQPVTVRSTGWTSVYRVKLFQAETAVNRGMQMLTASSAVLEITGGQGLYEDDETGERETGIEGLMSEMGRHAGLYMLGIMVISGAAILFALRILLDPKSLAEVALVHHLAVEKAQERRHNRSIRRSMARRGTEAGMMVTDDIPEWNDSAQRSKDREAVEVASLGTGMYDAFYHREYEDDRNPNYR